MKERVQGAVTAGVALVGAGVMAAAPAAQQAPEVLRSVNADVRLAATYDQTPIEALATSGQRTVESLAGAPLGLIAAAQAIAGGDNTTAYAILKNFVDGPLYVADPTIYAIDDLLPAPFGGDANNETTERGDSLITQFRADVLYTAREDVGEALRDSLGVGTASQPAGNEVSPVYAATRLGGGLGVSALRAAQSAVTAPLGLVAVAEGLQKSLNGDGNTDLYLALQSYIDGPNYVTDPVVFAVDDVLPQPTGGDLETNPAKMHNSDVTRFRGNVLLAPRDAVRKSVAGALGVDPVDGEPVTNTSANQLSKTAATSAEQQKGPISRVVSSLKATPGSASTASTGGKHRAPTAGGLSHLFKKKEDKKSESSTDSADSTK